MMSLGIRIRYRHNAKRNIVFLSARAAIKCLVFDKHCYDR